MNTQKRRCFIVCVALGTCIATFTSVSWLSSVIALQHASLSKQSSPQSRDALLGKTDPSGITVAVAENADLSGIASTSNQGRSELQDTGGESRSRSTKDGVHRVSVRIQGSQADQCRPMYHTDYWGDALVWGSTNKKSSMQECCEACRAYQPLNDDEPSCNVWVYCGDKDACGGQYQECWIKHLLHPEASAPRTGPTNPWTSGVVGLPEPVDPTTLTTESSEERKFHVVITAQGPPTHWQARVHYYWYKKIQKQCEERGNCQMGGWTRLLHSGEPDELMEEIPTHVVKPLIDKDNKGYVVLNRPWAFVQWLKEVTVPEKYIFMSEPDHVWLKPMPNVMIGHKPAAFPFFYITPSDAKYAHITQKFTGKLTRQQIESISPIGNAPTLLTYSDLKKVAQTWMNTSHAIFDDQEAHKAWGWVLEMYGFTIACHKAGVPPASLHLKMMAQPPWDNDVPYGPNYYILHYTYGMDYDLDGKFTPGKVGEWHFDKRAYAEKPPPRNLKEPPKGVDNTLTRHLIQAINEATAAIPGWDEYAETGVAKQFWDGTFPS